MGLWWALTLAAVAAIGFYVLRRDWPLSTAKRVIVTCLLGLGVMGPLFVALNPIWIEPIPPLPGRPLVTVLVDGTMSMKVEDSDAGSARSRWRRSVEIAGEVHSTDDTIDLRKQSFSEIVKTLPNDAVDNDEWPQGHRTDLADVLRQTIRSGSPLGHAILLLSDGAHNAGSAQSVLAVAREADSLATPIYTVTIGSSVGMKNLSLAARSPRMLAFPNNPIVLRIRVAHSGLAGQTTSVSLERNGQVIANKSVALTGDPNQELRFELSDGPTQPLQRFQIVAGEVPGEATVADNRTTVLVQRLDEPIGVLLLEGKPYWDSKFLARNLGADPVVQLTSMIRLGPSRILEKRLLRNDKPLPDASTPSSIQGSGEGTDVDEASVTEDWKIQTEFDSPLENRELLDNYRLVILGRDADTFLSDVAIENLRFWISHSGGCLMCSRGAPSDSIAGKLAEILPVRWQDSEEARFRTRVSQYGIDAAVFDPLLAEGSDPLSSLPSLAIGSVPKRREGLPQVLIQSVIDSSGDSIPVVTYQPYGSGQTIVVEGAGMWRWAFLPPQHANKDKIYPTLWQSIIQWIVSQQDVLPGQRVAIRPDRASFLAGDRATASVLVKEPTQFQDASGQLELAVLLQSVGDSLPKRITPAASGLDADFFRVDFGPLDVGFYTATVVHGARDEVLAETALEVRDPWFESLEVDARPDLMRAIARTSGGDVLQPGEVSGFIDRFEQRLAASRPQKMVRSTLWDRPFVLLLILSGWITTWIVRRRSGLI